MRILLVGPSRPETAARGRMLAERLGVAYLAPAAGESASFERMLGAHTAGFVLDGFPSSVAEARALDAFLRSRAAELDVALHLDGPSSAAPAEDELLTHYRGRVVELDAVGSDEEVLERMLDGLREALVAA
ncbi:MAG: hypothetical protein QM598_00370 [Protaetiibacter sp.]